MQSRLICNTRSISYLIRRLRNTQQRSKNSFGSATVLALEDGVSLTINKDVSALPGDIWTDQKRCAALIRVGSVKLLKEGHYDLSASGKLDTDLTIVTTTNEKKYYVSVGEKEYYPLRHYFKSPQQTQATETTMYISEGGEDEDYCG